MGGRTPFRHRAGWPPVPLAQSLLVLLAIGLAWQFVLVMLLVWREQRSLKWSVLREALWLRAPQSPRTGRVGGRVWLVLIPLSVLFYVEGLIPSLPPAAGRDFGLFLGSDTGAAFFQGAWGWYGLLIVMWIFNTVLGEELLFRGLLLPRMNGAFGRADWLVNGVLFATCTCRGRYRGSSPIPLYSPTRRSGIGAHGSGSRSTRRRPSSWP